MRYVLTVGGETGPKTRDDVCDAVKAFITFYGREPTSMTIMPAAVPGIAEWVRAELPADGPGLIARLEAGDVVRWFGVALRLGPAYTISA